MFKKIFRGALLYILILVFIVPIIILLLFGNASRKQRTSNVNISSPLPNNQNVPLPSKEDVVRNFCNLIDEGRFTEAIEMMNIEDDSIKQAWGVYFNNFSSFELKNIKVNSIDETGNSFEVDIKVSLKKDLQDLPIPNNGWVDGLNKKWISVIDDGSGNISIGEIATGP
jgi:hypothetical protein